MSRFTKRTGESRTTPPQRRKERAQSLVEMAFVLPVFLVLVMGVIDFSWGLKSWISITNAAREAARFGAIYCSSGDETAATVEQRAIDTATGLGLTAADVDVTGCTTGSSTNSIVVSIDYDYDLVTPLGGMMSMFGGGLPDVITLHSEADMRIE